MPTAIVNHMTTVYLTIGICFFLQKVDVSNTAALICNFLFTQKSSFLIGLVPGPLFL